MIPGQEAYPKRINASLAWIWNLENLQLSRAGTGGDQKNVQPLVIDVLNNPNRGAAGSEPVQGHVVSGWIINLGPGAPVTMSFSVRYPAGLNAWRIFRTITWAGAGVVWDETGIFGMRVLPPAPELRILIGNLDAVNATVLEGTICIRNRYA